MTLAQNGKYQPGHLFEAERADVAKGLNVSLEQLRERTEILQETKSFYTQLLQALQKKESLRLDKETFKEKLATGEALEIEKTAPYSLKFHDDFNLKLAESLRSRDTARLALVVAEKALHDARDSHQRSSAQARSLKEGFILFAEIATLASLVRKDLDNLQCFINR